MGNNNSGILSHGMVIDSIIVDCNDIVGAAMGGQYMKFCTIAVAMVQKLSKLKAGLEAEEKDREMLKKKELIDKGGVDDGQTQDNP